MPFKRRYYKPQKEAFDLFCPPSPLSLFMAWENQPHHGKTLPIVGLDAALKAEGNSQVPFSKRTTPTVRNNIYRSSHMDQ
jgi:hypothetical protein